MEINAVAIDDEPLALEIIQSYCSKIQTLDLKASFTDPIEGLQYLKANQVDLLFLDIHMKDLNGIQLLSILPNKPMVIFTSAYDKYALKGFELDVVDFLLKPIPFDRFLVSIDKTIDRLKLKNQNSLSFNNQINDTNIGNYCFVKADHKLKKIFFDDILYIEGMGDYLKIVTENQKIMTLNNFKKFETVLPESKFCRVHKSYIVALDKINNIEKNKIFIGTNEIPISEKYRAAFFEKLDKMIVQ